MLVQEVKHMNRFFLELLSMTFHSSLSHCSDIAAACSSRGHHAAAGGGIFSLSGSVSGRPHFGSGLLGKMNVCWLAS